jgi:transposase
MSGIPEATAVILTAAERRELEGLARSTKTEHRLRQRARIVLLAAGGMASRAIGREVRCTTGTASKWRVRYAERRLAGLDETGERGAEPKYTSQTDKRILALLDQPLAEYIEPDRRDPARTVERLLAVLDNENLAHALDRMKRLRLLRLVE